MAKSFENVRKRATQAAEFGALDESVTLRRLDPRQRLALALLRSRDTVTNRDVEHLFALSQCTARNPLATWVRTNHLSLWLSFSMMPRDLQSPFEKARVPAGTHGFAPGTRGLRTRGGRSG